MHCRLLGRVNNTKENPCLGVSLATKSRLLLKMDGGDYTSCEVIEWIKSDDGHEGATVLLDPFLQDKFFDYYGRDVVDIFPVGRSFELKYAADKVAIFEVLSHKMTQG